jgi:hypothetical protein
MIIFQNNGEIERTAFSYFGVNVKTSNDAIGYFGTGLKYALSVLLRHGCSITIHAGLTKYEVVMKEMEFRGKKFNAICTEQDGVLTELGFTDEVGKNWELWMAYRELYSNCKDESGQIIQTTVGALAAPEEGMTKIVIFGKEFESVHELRHEIFIEKDFDVCELKGVHVHGGKSDWMFVKGIRCSELPAESMFTYDLRHGVVLTEDRTIRDTYSAKCDLARAIVQSSDKKFLRAVLGAQQGTFEHDLDYHGWHQQPSIEFLDVVGEYVNDKVGDVNQTALLVWQETSRGSIKPKEIQLTEIQQKQFDDAVRFCHFLKFNVDEYPISFVESLGGQTLAFAVLDDKKIIVAQRVFDIGGAKQLASTLIEEFIHIKYGYSDATRSMQTFLFERMVSIGEELYGRAV